MGERETGEKSSFPIGRLLQGAAAEMQLAYNRALDTTPVIVPCHT